MRIGGEAPPPPRNLKSLYARSNGTIEILYISCHFPLIFPLIFPFANTSEKFRGGAQASPQAPSPAYAPECHKPTQIFYI